MIRTCPQTHGKQLHSLNIVNARCFDIAMFQCCTQVIGAKVPSTLLQCTRVDNPCLNFYVAPVIDRRLVTLSFVRTSWK
jgi:hypothetical protein